MTKIYYKIAISLLATTLFTACYRMPSEDDYSVVPSTNNPDITNAKSESCLPNLKY